MPRIKNGIKRYFLIFNILIAANIFVFSTCYGQEEGDFVPVRLAKKAALHYAQEVFGQLKFWQIRTCYNVDDDPSAYVVTFYSGSGQRPNLNDVIRKTAAERTKRIELEEQLAQENQTTPAQRAVIAGKISKAWTRMRQEQDFVTVITSATSGRPPIMQMYRGLPPHIVGLEDAREVARKQLKSQNIRLKKLIHYGLFDFTFEFEEVVESELSAVPPVSKGRKTLRRKKVTAEKKSILVDPLRFKKTTRKGLKRKKRLKFKRKKTQKKWDFIKDLPSE